MILDALPGELGRKRVESPLERARDGTLLVRDAHRLPEPAQQAIVRALAFRTGPATDPVPLDVRVVPRVCLLVLSL